MRKAVTVFLVIAILCGGFYYCLQTGYIDKWFPGMMEKIIPGYTSSVSENGGRVSSTDANAVYMDSVQLVAELGSGTGKIARFAGTVEPQETKEYKLEGDRKVKKCYVKEGDIVDKGQKLFTYDTTDDESKLEQARIDLERLQNTEDTSEAKKAELEKQKAAADTPEKKLEVLTAENEIKQNELDQKSKKKEIEQLENQIKNSTVKSDLDGVIKSVNDQNTSSSNDLTGSTDAAYISILKLGTYRVKAEANEQNIKQVYTGEAVIVFSRVDSKTYWKGTISQIKTDKSNSENEDGYSADNLSGSSNYPFYVELEDSEGLMLGQHVYLEQDLGQENAKSGLWLYDYYLAEESDGTHYVWAASSDNKVEKRVVELGESDDILQMHQIVSGLTTDDYICQPQERLEEGLPVNYNDPSGEGETESAYNWTDGAFLEEDLDNDFYMDDETEVYTDEDESELMEDLEAYESYEENVDEGSYETDAEGFVIMR